MKWLRLISRVLIIWGDDIGWFNISTYNHGIMGYRTPNIDRIAKEAGVVMFPVVLIYTCIVYWIFRGKVGKVRSY